MAKGVVYGLTATLAVNLALGDSGQSADQQGALRTLAEQPFGRVLLLALAVGLMGYALWRVTEASLSGNRDAQAMAKRLGYLASGALYAGLAVGAGSMALSAGDGGGSDVQGVTGRVMDWPFGRWLIGAAGLGIMVLGAIFAWRGARRDFLDELKLGAMRAERRRRIEVLGVAAWCGRGAVFALVGWFVVQAAVNFDPREATGLDGALRKVLAATYGPALLLLVAAGLAAYALYCLVESRYRRFAGP